MPTRRSSQYDSVERMQERSVRKHRALLSCRRNNSRVSDVAEELDRLAEELRYETNVEGTYFSRIWIRVGLLVAAEVIERRRFQILTQRIADNVARD